MLLSPNHIKTMSPHQSPRFSIIIPARNEERYLPHCLDSISRVLHAYETSEAQPSQVTDATKNQATQGSNTAEGPPALEIVVVLNRCTDRTEEIARSRGCKIVQEDAKNLARIRNVGVRAASGDVIVTLDADSTMSAKTLIEIDRIFRRGKTLGGGMPILPERWSLGIALTGLLIGGVLLWHRISVGSFFCRREDFWAINGFNETLASVEDIDFAIRLRRLAKSRKLKFSHLWRTPIKTSCRKFDFLGDWYFIRNLRVTLTLLKGHHQGYANAVWYDFERK